MITYPSFPLRRMRRMRRDDFSRKLAQESLLTTSDLIYPVFITDRPSDQIPIASMPGQNRLGEYALMSICEACCEQRIPAIAIFPVIEDALKSLDAKEAYHPEGLVPKTVQKIKERFPQLGVITDVALDPYTSHGQDGLIDESGYVLNDETIVVLKKQAICHAQAGADIVAPSDMMDGRIGAIRQELDKHSQIQTKILAYSAKYASAFYGPFRDAVGSKTALGRSDKKNYQMNPSNRKEALFEAAQDLEEGADIIMVKPGCFYLDVISLLKESFQTVTFAYQVSGEYSMIKAGGEKGWIDERACMMESLTALKRAGSDGILTYFALDAARLLNQAIS